MPIPSEDRLDNLCRQDMNTIEASVGAIRDQIKKGANLTGTNTWVGAPADKWGADFTGRMATLGRLFDSYPAEEQRLISKAQQDQNKLNSHREKHPTACRSRTIFPAAKHRSPHSSRLP